MGERRQKAMSARALSKRGCRRNPISSTLGCEASCVGAAQKCVICFMLF